MRGGDATNKARIRALRGAGFPDVVRRVLHSAAVVALAGRFARWVDGHQAFDVAMSQGRPVKALRVLVRSWVKTSGANMAARRRTCANPIGFPQQHSGRVRLIGEGAKASSRPSSLRRSQAVVVGSAVDRPSRDELMELAAYGVPLICETAGVTGLIDDGVGSGALRDVRVRELHSIGLRRRALQLVHGASLEQPISVVLATRRAADLPQALEMIAHQQHAPLEVLVGLHGSEFDTGVEQRLDGPGRRLFRYSDEWNLGAVLSDLTDRSSGALVTKWDDDDWYGSHHLGDLALALGYSGADLVGKAAEFVYLSDLGVTVRRLSVGAETFSSTLAGGTLMMRREALDRAGGWPLTSRHVDIGVIARFEANGGRVYRTHGFEYVLRRSRTGHTWSVSSSYFVAQSVDQRSGLDLSFAGIGDV